MTEHEASRTLVKSPPELWAACSDPETLGRHLEPFGEIRITRLEPETTVAWEGERASGTVRIEPSGCGTKVTLTAAATDGGAVAAPEVAAASEPEPVPERHVEPEPQPEPTLVATPPAPPMSPAPRRRGLLGWVLGRLRGPQPLPAEAPPVAPPAQTPSLPEPAEASSVPEPAEPGPEPAAVAPAASAAVPHAGPDPIDSAATLRAALDSLGQAHHRPFSRG